MLTNDGQVYACGTFRDANGSIGLTEAGPHKEAHHLPCEKRIVKIASGGDHILALSEEGLVYSVGELDCILALSEESLVYSVGELDCILALSDEGLVYSVGELDCILALSEEGLVYSVGKLDCILAFSGEGLVYSVGELDCISALDHQKSLINICVATRRIEELSILS